MQISMHVMTNACDDLIIVAAFEVLDMSSLGDTPNVPAIPNPENAWMQSSEEREKMLKETSMLIMRKFVNIEFHGRSNTSSSDSVHDYI